MMNTAMDAPIDGQFEIVPEGVRNDGLHEERKRECAKTARIISSRKRDKELNLEALETLVVTFGPREAARQAGMSANTVLSLAKRKGWKQARPEPGKKGKKPSPQAAANIEGMLQASSQVPNSGDHVQLQGRKETEVLTSSICNQSAGKALASVMSNLKGKSTLNLALYSAKASKAALQHKKPLEISRKVKDVADIHKTLWPTEAESKNILQIGFIISGK